MERVATKTQTAPISAKPLRAPRLPLSGTNEALDAAIFATQALFDAYPELSDAHTAAEEAANAAPDNARAQAAWDRIDARFQARLSQMDRALGAILKVDVATQAEADIKLDAVMMGHTLMCVPSKRWRRTDAAQAVRALHRQPFDLGAFIGPVFERYIRDVRGLRAPAAPPPSPAPAGDDGKVIAAGARFAALDAELDRLNDVAPFPAEESQAVVARMQAPIDVSLSHRATTIAGLIAKARIADYYQPTEACDEFEDLHWKVQRSLVADILALADGQGPHPDAELLALGAEFEARWAAQRAYPIEDGDEGYQALADRTNEVSNRIRKIGASTWEGLRVKARVVQECQGDELTAPVEFTSGDDLSDTIVAAGIVNDLLGISERPADEREADAAQECEALSRLRGHRVPAGMNNGTARAWYAARDRFHAAKTASAAYTPERDAEDPRGSDAALDAAADAMEAWESLPPPSLDALVEVMGASIGFNGLEHTWQSVKDPRALRDLLDSGDTHQIFAARFYLHALRLLGQHHAALSAVPIAGLFQKDHGAGGWESREAWVTHHHTARVYPTRRAELADWWRVILADPAQRDLQVVAGADNVRAVATATGFGREPLNDDVIAAAPQCGRGSDALRLARAI